MCVSNLQKKIFQLTILNLKFQLPPITVNNKFKFQAIENIKILGVVLELPAKQHCQSSPFTAKTESHSCYLSNFDWFSWGWTKKNTNFLEHVSCRSVKKWRKGHGCDSTYMVARPSEKGHSVCIIFSISQRRLKKGLSHINPHT